MSKQLMIVESENGGWPKVDKPTEAITREYTVWCGYCPGFRQVSFQGTFAASVKVFKEWGWKYSAGRWKCPDCLAWKEIEKRDLGKEELLDADMK